MEENKDTFLTKKKDSVKTESQSTVNLFQRERSTYKSTDGKSLKTKTSRYSNVKQLSHQGQKK